MAGSPTFEKDWLRAREPFRAPVVLAIKGYETMVKMMTMVTRTLDLLIHFAFAGPGQTISLIITVINSLIHQSLRPPAVPAMPAVPAN